MRKKHASKRIAISDPKFGDLLVNRFINNIMKDGKKHRAQTILYDAIEIIGERAKTQTPIRTINRIFVACLQQAQGHNDAFWLHTVISAGLQPGRGQFTKCIWTVAIL